MIFCVVKKIWRSFFRYVTMQLTDRQKPFSSLVRTSIPCSAEKSNIWIYIVLYYKPFISHALNKRIIQWSPLTHEPCLPLLPSRKASPYFNHIVFYIFYWCSAPLSRIINGARQNLTMTVTEIRSSSSCNSLVTQINRDPSIQYKCMGKSWVQFLGSRPAVPLWHPKLQLYEQLTFISAVLTNDCKKTSKMLLA